jgi:hypothetical protein
MELALDQLAVCELHRVRIGSLEASPIVAGALGSADDDAVAGVDELFWIDAERGPVIGDLGEVGDDLVTAARGSPER